MSTMNSSITARIFPPPTKPITELKKPISLSLSSSQFLASTLSRSRRPYLVLKSVTEDRDLVTAKTISSNFNEEEAEAGIEREAEEREKEKEKENSQPTDRSEEFDRFVGRTINATIVLGVGTLAITKLLTIDHDYWQGWTLYEVLRYAPEHNWIAYEEALKANPVLAKMAISGVVYSVGDWIAQCYEGKPLFEFDRTQLFRSGLVGFACMVPFLITITNSALIPSKDWWVVPTKVAFDQTAWAALWNSIYFVVLGFLRFESPAKILDELKATFWPMLTAGWKLWPFAHLITYGVVPVEQRLLWVDCVELIWVTILSTYSNEKSEARISEATSEENSSPSSTSVSEE